jgi:hypothetical protein
MPQLLKNQSRLQALLAAIFFLNTRLHPWPESWGSNAGAAGKHCGKSHFLAIKRGLSG